MKYNKWILKIAICLAVYLGTFIPMSYAQAAVPASMVASPAQQGNVSKPYMIIAGYSAGPKDITPGETFKLRLNVKNESSERTKNILVSIGIYQSSGGSDEGGTPAQSSNSLIAIGSGNSRYIKELSGGKEQSIEFNLVASPKADPGIHPLGVTIEYSNGAGNSFSANQQIGIKVARKINLRFQNVSSPLEITEGEQIDISADLINASNFKVGGVSLEIVARDARIEGETSVFIGTLESSDSESIEVKLFPRGSKKFQEVKLLAKYEDDFNQQQTVEEVFQVKIEPKPKPVNGAQEVSLKKTKKAGFLQKIGNFFKGLLGL